MNKESFKDESSLSEFICAICLNIPLLSEATLSTKYCQHVFCSKCLEEWQKRADKCPTCNRERLDRLPLREYSPLGFRIFEKLQIKCSLSGCNWIGDYCDLDDHLTSSDTHKDTAYGLKEVANERYSNGHFVEALKLYDKALNICSSEDVPLRSILLSNKAATLLKLGKPKQVAETCEKAFQIGAKDAKIFVRWSQALTQLGKFHEATQVLSTPAAVLVMKPSYLHKAQQIETAWEESAKAIVKSEFEQAKMLLAPILQDPQASGSPKVISRIALIEAHIGQLDVALRLSLESCRNSPDDECAWIARSLALLSSGQFEEAKSAAKQALRLSPDDESCKAAIRHAKSVELAVQGARQAADKHEWEKARELLIDLVQGNTLPKNSPLRVQLLAERAHVSFCAEMYDDALKDASAAIAQQDDCQRAWLTRLYCLQKLNRHEEAVYEGRQLLSSWGANDMLIRNAAEKAEFEWRKVKRPDLYSVLGVSSLATEMEIKQAYKKWLC